MEYIEREAAIKAVFGWYEKAHHPDNKSQYNEGEIAAYRTALSEIAKIPAADVQPVRHGRWFKKEDGECYWYVCSECGMKPPKDQWKYQWLSPYCPHCGAKMDECP